MIDCISQHIFSVIYRYHFLIPLKLFLYKLHWELIFFANLLVCTYEAFRTLCRLTWNKIWLDNINIHLLQSNVTLWMNKL